MGIVPILHSTGLDESFPIVHGPCLTDVSTHAYTHVHNHVHTAAPGGGSMSMRQGRPGNGRHARREPHPPPQPCVCIRAHTCTATCTTACTDVHAPSSRHARHVWTHIGGTCFHALIGTPRLGVSSSRIVSISRSMCELSVCTAVCAQASDGARAARAIDTQHVPGSQITQGKRQGHCGKWAAAPARSHTTHRSRPLSARAPTLEPPQVSLTVSVRIRSSCWVPGC